MASLFLIGLEEWYDFRRMGLPSVIVLRPDSVNSDIVPVGFLYPDSEQTINAGNFSATVSALGENTIKVK